MAVGDLILITKAAVTLEASGTSISAGAVVQANDANVDVSTQGNYPDGEFVFVGAFASAPTEGRVLSLLARQLDIDGAGNHADVPEATRTGQLIGAFVVNNVTSTQRMPLSGGVAYDIPRKWEPYIYNGTDQAVSAGWKLIWIPRTTTPATS